MFATCVTYCTQDSTFDCSGYWSCLSITKFLQQCKFPPQVPELDASTSLHQQNHLSPIDPHTGTLTQYQVLHHFLPEANALNALTSFSIGWPSTIKTFFTLLTTFTITNSANTCSGVFQARSSMLQAVSNTLQYVSDLEYTSSFVVPSAPFLWSFAFERPSAAPDMGLCRAFPALHCHQS